MKIHYWTLKLNKHDLYILCTTKLKWNAGNLSEKTNEVTCKRCLKLLKKDN
ncbi:MAG: hypothetical protein M0P71_01710 [Melioribacteraceae bacterium]|nr:hypothetical protein [Melioribacteraceae bacterium]